MIRPCFLCALLLLAGLTTSEAKRPSFLFIISDDQAPAAMPFPPACLSEHPFDNGDLRIRDEKLAPRVRTPEAIRVHRSEYYAIITHLDQQVGRILDALDASGDADNTYIIFTSDHGLAVGNHGLLGKQNSYDHSIRMPFTIVGPGIAADQHRSEKIYMQSVFPTTCEIAGLPIPASVEFTSLHGALLHDEPFAGEEVIFGGYMENQRYVRTDQYKLISYPNHNRTQLFDLLQDPHEIYDVSDSLRHTDTVRELTATLHRLQHEKGDGILTAH